MESIPDNETFRYTVPTTGESYTFTLVYKQPAFRIQVLTYPGGPRNGDTVEKHHLYGDKSICISRSHLPKTRKKAMAIAMAWCEGWSRYIRNGSFPTSGISVDVPDDEPDFDLPAQANRRTPAPEPFADRVINVVCYVGLNLLYTFAVMWCHLIRGIILLFVVSAIYQLLTEKHGAKDPPVAIRKDSSARLKHKAVSLEPAASSSDAHSQAASRSR
jgi:hypothetical protein